jgi:hypothetical protein
MHETMKFYDTVGFALLDILASKTPNIVQLILHFMYVTFTVTLTVAVTVHERSTNAQSNGNVQKPKDQL